MPRYHFDLHEDLDLSRDEDGAIFETDEDARVGALHRLSDVLRSMNKLGPKTKLLVLAVRRAGEREPFAAVSLRVSSLR